MSYYNVIADDKNVISYRPKLRQIAGSVTATIFLQQCMHWWRAMGYEPFYKFASPSPKSLRYNKGDSWEEELGFSYAELKTARGKVAVKAKASNWREALKDNLVVYWTDLNRMTWYAVNDKLIDEKLALIYVNEQSNITVIEESDTTVIEDSNIPYYRDYSETTTENLDPPENPPKATVTNGPDNLENPFPFQDNTHDGKSEADLRVGAIAQVCQLDLSIPRIRSQCQQAAAETRGYTACFILGRYGDEQTQRAVDYPSGEWQWYPDHWLGKQGKRPSIPQLIESIAYEPNKPATNGHTPAKPTTQKVWSGPGGAM